MKDDTINLCDTCANNCIPECFPDNEKDIEFGKGYGNDNIIKCSNYKNENEIDYSQM